jgi:hypothetical protein
MRTDEKPRATIAAFSALFKGFSSRANRSCLSKPFVSRRSQSRGPGSRFRARRTVLQREFVGGDVEKKQHARSSGSIGTSARRADRKALRDPWISGENVRFGASCMNRSSTVKLGSSPVVVRAHGRGIGYKLLKNSFFSFDLPGWPNYFDRASVVSGGSAFL